MGKGLQTLRRRPPAFLRHFLLLLPLGVVLAASMLLASHWQFHVTAPTTAPTMAGCSRDRRKGLQTLMQNPKVLRNLESTQCGQPPHADVEWIEGPEGQARGAHTCKGFQRVCLDQGGVVLHDESYVGNGTGFTLPTFEISDFLVCPNNESFCLLILVPQKLK